MELFFDTETSGFMSKKIHYAEPRNAWVVQLAMILSDADNIYGEFSAIIKPDDRKINPHAQKVHGISTEVADNGLSEADVLNLFAAIAHDKQYTLVCHNVAFDIPFLQGLIYRGGFIDEANKLLNIPQICTMKASVDLCQLPFPSGRSWGSQKYKWPKLEELHQHLFGESFENAHDALADVRATRRCYYELVSREII